MFKEVNWKAFVVMGAVVALVCTCCRRSATLRQPARKCDHHDIGRVDAGGCHVDKKAKNPKKPKQVKAKGPKTSKTQ